MGFSAEDRQEVVGLVRAVLEEEHHTRRTAKVKAEEKEEDSNLTALYLITLAGHHIALPGEHGRAILTQCVYVRVKIDPQNPELFDRQCMEAIADGDGRKFKEPRNLILTGGQICSMIEVSESSLTDAYDWRSDIPRD